MGVLVSKDKRESEDYWLGVRDALRMIDSFVNWSRRNPGRAKTIDDFITDGLLAAAKRCESCLSQELGLSFTGESKDSESADEVSAPPSDEVAIEFEEPTHESELQFEDSPLSDAMGYSSSSDEVEIVASPETESIDLEELPAVEIPTEDAVLDIEEAESADIPHEPILPDEENGATLDEIEPTPGIEMDELELESTTRDFSSDFEVAEPEPYLVDPPRSSFDESVDTPEGTSSTETEPPAPPEDATVPPPPTEDEGFTWRDYESAVTPPEESTPEPDESVSEPISPPTTPETPATWSPYDEPSLPVDDSEESAEIEEDEVKTEDAHEDTSEPKPPPPPPPESDETEEERRRRARRLFFGT